MNADHVYEETIGRTEIYAMATSTISKNASRQVGSGTPKGSPNQPDLADRPRGTWQILVIVFLVAIAFRGAYLWGQYQQNPVFSYPQMDGLVHHQWAQRIAAGEGMEARPYLRAPLYYYLLAAAYKIFGPNVALARCAGSLLGALSCCLIARLGMVLAGRRVGLLAGLLAALYWPFVYFDAELLTTSLEVFLDVALLLALVSAGRTGSWKHFAGAGTLWGLSAIARPNVLAFAPIIWLWAWGSRTGGQSKRRWINAVAVTAAAFVVIAPVTLRNYLVGKEAVLIASSGGVNFFIGNNPDSTGYLVDVPGARGAWDEWLADTHAMAERDAGQSLTDGQVSSYWYRRAWKWIGSEPGAWFALLVHKFRLFWSPIELPNNQPVWFLAQLAGVSAFFWIGFPVVACLALGGLATIRRNAGRSWLIPLSFALVYMATVVAFFCPARFRIPVAPVFILLAAKGLAELPALLKGRRVGGLAIFALAAAVGTIFIATNPPDRAAFKTRALAEGHYLLGRYLATPEPDGPGDLKAAAEKYRASVAVSPTLQRRSAFARVLFELGEFTEASEQFSQAARENPGSVTAQLEWAEFLVSRGELEQATARYRGALAIAPSDPRIAASLNDVEYNLSTDMLADGRVADAARLLEGIIARDATNAAAWQNLGVAYAQLGRMDESISAFRKTLAISSAFTEASINLSKALVKTGRHDEAVAALERAIEEAPNNIDALTTIAGLLAMAPNLEQRNAARAWQFIERASNQVAQPSPAMVEIMAATMAEMGRFEDAALLAKRGLDGARSGGLAYWPARFEHAMHLYEQGQRFQEPLSSETED